MDRLTKTLSVFALSLSLGVPGAGAIAQEHAGSPHREGHQGAGHYGGHGGGGLYGRSFRSFSPHELHVWHGGHWAHDWHYGRYAWWWVTPGWWYLYPEPVYPYPLYVPPAIIAERAPPMPTGLPPAEHWYFCDNPQGYYPYVVSCDGPWRSVPATPAK
ncbi:MAG TPA: hypothetical protein VM689_25665 [Aliidongia sp.]|nr:hypothetical protein [Aliidongia sp.]